MNPLKELRAALGWSQNDLAREIGKSYASVQQYEQGKRVPPDVVEKLKTIAAKHGFADIALRLSSDDWQVTRVLHPGETLISQAKRNLQRRNPEESVDWHALLEEVLSSGQDDAINAVQSNLVCFTRLVRTRRPRTATKPHKKHA